MSLSHVTPAFEQFANSYDATTPIQSYVAAYLAQLIQRHFFVSQLANFSISIVDVGCGTGKLTQAVWQTSLQQLPRPPIKLVGVDISANMLAIWQQRVQHLAAFKDTRIQSQAICADMFDMPLAAQTADLVMSSFALHWTSPDVLTELTRLVKANGQLHIAIPVAGSLSEVSQRFPQLPVFDFLPSAAWLDAIQHLLDRGQGNILYQSEQSFLHRYDNLQSLLTHLKQMGGAVSGKNSLDTATFRRYLQDKSPVNLDYSLLMVGIQL